AGAIGVWGNHDLGLCHEPEPELQEKYPGPVVDFAASLRPSLELEGYFFTHGLPHWDPTDLMAYYLGEKPDQPEGVARSLAAVPHGVIFVGHFHRWLAATPSGRLTWEGGEPLHLRPEERWLVVVAAVLDGWCAVFDTDTRFLSPHRL